MSDRLRRLVIVSAAGCLVAGAAVASLAVTRAVLAKPSAAASLAYPGVHPCVGCAAGLSLDSVEVQARQGSTLFVLRGRWPASVDTLGHNVRLVANDLEVILNPAPIEERLRDCYRNESGCGCPPELSRAAFNTGRC